MTCTSILVYSYAHAHTCTCREYYLLFGVYGLFGSSHFPSVHSCMLLPFKLMDVSCESSKSEGGSTFSLLFPRSRKYKRECSSSDLWIFSSWLLATSNVLSLQANTEKKQFARRVRKYAHTAQTQKTERVFSRCGRPFRLCSEQAYNMGIQIPRGKHK